MDKSWEFVVQHVYEPCKPRWTEQSREWVFHTQTRERIVLVTAEQTAGGGMKDGRLDCE